jgi:hypothetical protein
MPQPKRSVISAHARDALWHRFKSSACALRRTRADDPNCQITISDREPEPYICVRLERRGLHTHVVALTVQVAYDSTHLRLRVHSVAIVDGSLRGRPTKFVPVSYDHQLDRYTIGTPPIADEQMADFFLDQAEVLLDSLGYRRP